VVLVKVNILLVEDDLSLSVAIEYALKAEGFNVNVAGTLQEAKNKLSSDIDIVLLDVMLPDGLGYDFCKSIREKSQLPVIFLTACDEEANIVMGLDIGGDDYITKPFRIKELVSRIRAVKRRTVKSSVEECGVLSSMGITVNTMESKVFKDNVDVQLTNLEYRLLLVFLNNPRQVLTRNRLLEILWDVNGEFVDDNALSVYIRRLREKIELRPDKPEIILTVRGTGYKWDSDVN